MPAPVIAGTPTTFGAASGTTHDLAKPAGLANGDHLVALLRAQGTDWAADWQAPAGFVRHGPAFVPTSTTYRVIGAWVKKVTDAANEPAAYTFTANKTTSRRLGVLLIVRGASGVAGATAGSYGGTQTGTTAATAPTYTPANANSEPGLVLVWAGGEFTANNTATPNGIPAGYTAAAALRTPTDDTVSRTGGWAGTAPHTAAAAVPAATVAWPVVAAQAAVGLTFQGAPVADPRGPGHPIHDGAGNPARLYVHTADGPRTPSDVRILPPGYGTVANMLAGEFWWAHRGGSVYAEHSLHAYTQSIANGYRALEISLNRTGDGVWFGLHDPTLDRTSSLTGANLDPVAMTWNQVQQYTITIGKGAPQPYMTWDALIDTYGDTDVLICDPKHRFVDRRAEFLDRCSAIGPDRCIVKYFYDTTGLRDAAQARGLKTWGYLYAASIDADPLWASRAAGWDILGLDYTAPQSYFDQVLALGKPVVAHICPNQAAVDLARSKGATGFQCSATDTIRPF